jgi:hypothetical protein
MTVANKTPSKRTIKKPAKPDPDMTDVDTAIAAGGSAGFVIALLKASGVTLTAQQAAALTATDTQHKTDVNVPELITSLNGLVFSQAVKHAGNVDAINLNTVAMNQEFNATNKQMMMDHRDQNHNKQINVDEQVAAVAAMYARFFATLNNPIPPEK